MPMIWEHLKCGAAVNGEPCTEKAELDVIRSRCKCGGEGEFGTFYICRPHLGDVYDSLDTTTCADCGDNGWAILLILDLTRWPVVLDCE